MRFALLYLVSIPSRYYQNIPLFFKPFFTLLVSIPSRYYQNHMLYDFISILLSKFQSLVDIIKTQILMRWNFVRKILLSFLFLFFWFLPIHYFFVSFVYSLFTFIFSTENSVEVYMFTHYFISTEFQFISCTALVFTVFW